MLGVKGKMFSSVSVSTIQQKLPTSRSFPVSTEFQLRIPGLAASSSVFIADNMEFRNRLTISSN